MTETATPPATTQNQSESKTETKSKVERAQHLVHTVSMTVGVIGATGTALVWLAANVFVGDVVIQPDKPVQSVIVKVYDKRGQDATYHLRQFQLMPGNYHLEVTPDGNKTQHADVEVKFGQKCVVPVTVTSGQDDSAGDMEQPSQKHHWWQFWRK